jgi:hypothetical protein
MRAMAVGRIRRGLAPLRDGGESDRALAQASAVAAAVPLREAAARGGAEYVYAHRGRESLGRGRDPNENAGPAPCSGAERSGAAAGRVALA